MLLIVVFALLACAAFIPSEVLGLDTDPYLSTVIVELIIFVVPSIFFCTLRGGEYRSRLRLSLPSPACLLMTLCAAALMITGSAVIEYFMSLAFSDSLSSTSAAETASFAMNSGLFDGFYLVIAFALLPAITEELLFRGIIMTEYSSLGVVCSVIMSALTFAMAHMSPIRLPEYIFCGIILSLLTYACRSVTAAMAAHALYNAVVIFFEKTVIKIAESRNISSILFVIIAAAAAIALAAAFAFEASSLYRTYGVENAPSDYLPQKKASVLSSLAISLFSPPFLLLAVMYIALSVIKS